MLGNLGGAHAQLINFIVLLGRVLAHEVSRVVALLSEGVGELG